ncbi:MAG: biosynthetic arginine decarboxylase [Cyanothece sp. SIO2G6]|nr:biosynthetic arginine decarboxylase [Cyanothece sp. SIO2G6]
MTITAQEQHKHSQQALGKTTHLNGAKTQPTWSIEDSEDLYQIQGWGEPYFSINAIGHITVSPKGDRGGSLDLFALVESLRERQLELPLLIRFPDILEDRIERLNACFAKAIARYNYPGSYQGVFPIKCNQQRHLVEDLVHFGTSHQFGLEAGSKPELMIALAALDTPGALLICNGYKDHEYIETALLAQRLGHQCLIVLEQPSELEIVLAMSRLLEIPPLVGVRARLSVKGSGRWAGTTGDRAKFGLTIPEIIAVIDQLKAVDCLQALQLLHFHIGSQISSIGIIKDALREASQIYVELVKLGANMRYLDVGGGLGVDYDGTKTNSPASKNYNMQNYANDVVAAIKEACEADQLPVPTIVSESGRAIASHQSVLIFDVLGSSGVMAPTGMLTPTVKPASDATSDATSDANGSDTNSSDTNSSDTNSQVLHSFIVDDNDHAILHNLLEAYESMSPRHYQEAYHDAVQFKEEALSLFNFGYLSIIERAKVEELYWACCRRVLELGKQQAYAPDDITALGTMMSFTYYINLSVFRSAPDSWAINQLFPIMPIHRLNEAPTCQAILADLTCDSDGKISRFIDRRGEKSLLDVHSLVPDQPYYLGLFLGGAYQEIMGNLHNLFGSTNIVHICLTPKGYTVEHVVRGNTVADVLQAVEYDIEDLLEHLRRRTEQALHDQRITLREARLLLQNYERSLHHYTYLTSP